MAPSLSSWGPGISVATIPSDKGSDIPPMPPTDSGFTKEVWERDSIARLVFWFFRYLYIFSGFFILSLYNSYHLNVFVRLGKIGLLPR